MTLYVQELTAIEQIDDIANEWKALDEHLSPRTPFTSHQWMRLWWKHYKRHGFLATDHLFFHIVREANGELIAVAPMMLTHRPGLGPFKIRVISFFGADTSITELRGVICKAEHQAEVVGALADFLFKKRNEWDIILWKGLRLDGTAKEVLRQRGSVIKGGELSDYIMHLPKTWDELRLSVSANMRKNVRKAYEFLERDGHQFEFRIVEKRSEMAVALDRFFFLHSSRANVSDMITHPDKFAAPDNHAFLVECANELADQNIFRIFELKVGGTVVASRLAFLLGDNLYFYYAGYEPKWRDHSVMTVLMTEILKWAIAQGLPIANLSTGTDQSKLRWKPTEIGFQDFTQPSPTFRGRMFTQVYLKAAEWSPLLRTKNLRVSSLWRRQQATVPASPSNESYAADQP